MRIARRAYSTITTRSGKVTNVTSASWMSLASSTTMIATALMTSPMIVIAPCENISLRLSMSLVIRVISRPTGMRSKNAARWASTWSKIAIRRSCIVRWPASWTSHCSKNDDRFWPITRPM